jgi:ABC-type iron transport system FetAB ATPase subunit
VREARDHTKRWIKTLTTMKISHMIINMGQTLPIVRRKAMQIITLPKEVAALLPSSFGKITKERKHSVDIRVPDFQLGVVQLRQRPNELLVDTIKRLAKGT